MPGRPRQAQSTTTPFYVDHVVTDWAGIRQLGAMTDMWDGWENDVQNDDAVLPVSTNSMGGRNYTLRPTAVVQVQKDPRMREWGVMFLKERDIWEVEFVSATSGSSLRAVAFGDGMWQLTVSVPSYADGTFYEGEYYRLFLKVVTEHSAAAV